MRVRDAEAALPEGRRVRDLRLGEPVGAMSPESLKRKQEAELKNGRLAMIGFMSFLAANNIEGSVPMVPHSEAAKSILGL